MKRILENLGLVVLALVPTIFFGFWGKQAIYWIKNGDPLQMILPIGFPIWIIILIVYIQNMK